MEPKKGLQALLETIQSWLERAGDDEVLALYNLVRDELTRRRVHHTPIRPGGADKASDQRTPPNNNS